MRDMRKETASKVDCILLEGREQIEFKHNNIMHKELSCILS